MGGFGLCKLFKKSFFAVYFVEFQHHLSKNDYPFFFLKSFFNKNVWQGLEIK
jgi:hypothetical protein